MIRQLQSENTIILGVTPLTSLIFEEEFPALQKVMIEPYKIVYSNKLPLWCKLLLDSRRILSVIKKEREQLKKIIHDYNVDVVISDNRFGLYNSGARCIYITHQLNIQAGLLSGLANRVHHNYMKRFQEIWVPDFENEKDSLAGKLSRKSSFKNIQYLGPLSRLRNVKLETKNFDYLCLLSGPEPERTRLENLLMQKAIKSNKQICLVRGTRLVMETVPAANVHIIDLPDSKQLSDLIGSSKTIVCRSGYSTLMDLYTLKHTKCILIPTPSQSEQIYLAKYWKEKFGVKVFKQSELDSFDFL